MFLVFFQQFEALYCIVILYCIVLYCHYIYEFLKHEVVIIFQNKIFLKFRKLSASIFL